MPAARCTSSPASGHKRATATAPAVTIAALVSIRVSSMSSSSAAVTGLIALWSPVPSRSERSAQRPQPGQRGLAAEDLHRLEQRRRDPATGDPDTQGREGKFGLDAQTLHQGRAQCCLDVGPSPLWQSLERRNRGVEHYAGIVFELSPGIVLDDKVAIADEEEGQHSLGLGEQLHAFLDQWRRSLDQLDLRPWGLRVQHAGQYE